MPSHIMIYFCPDASLLWCRSTVDDYTRYLHLLVHTDWRDN